MAPSSTGSFGRLVQLSRSADNDRFSIYAYTAEQWSDQQAEDYTAFLSAVMQQLADNPASAPRVPNDKTARVFVARWNNTRQGHRIFFDETPTGILVLRIIHTAQNWPDNLRDE